MATVTGFTADRMQQIEDNVITAADVVDGELILARYDGSELNVGTVVPDTGEIAAEVTNSLIDAAVAAAIADVEEASTEIPDLPPSAALDGTELLAAHQDGGTVKVSLNDINAMYRFSASDGSTQEVTGGNVLPLHSIWSVDQADILNRTLCYESTVLISNPTAGVLDSSVVLVKGLDPLSALTPIIGALDFPIPAGQKFVATLRGTVRHDGTNVAYTGQIIRTAPAASAVGYIDAANTKLSQSVVTTAPAVVDIVSLVGGDDGITGKLISARGWVE